MIYPKNLVQILLFWAILLVIIPKTDAQTKKLKRPSSNIGISSVDIFVSKSFDIYEKVYTYDGYAAAGTSLKDEDLEALEDTLTDLESLSDSALDILDDLDGRSVIKQTKATLRINKAKKALKYSIKTSKALLLGQRSPDKKVNDSSGNSPRR